MAGLLSIFKLDLNVTIISLVLSIFNGILLCLVAYRSLQTLQLRGYKTERYMHWLSNTHGRYFSRLFMLCFMSANAVIVVNILFHAFETSVYTLFSLVLYFVYLISFIKHDFKTKKKTPLVVTNRIKRMMVLLFFLCVLMTYLFFLLSFSLHSYSLGWLKFVFICFTPLITPFLVLISFIIMLPWENTHNHNFVKKATKKLNENPNLIKIGITGSYGKTSVKNILTSMLSQKYNVLTTPSSYNTPMGLTKVILKQLNNNHEVFVAEMGARYKGDIKYICDFVNPKYGIITAVANQHLESFKSIENIMDTKFELVESLPSDGIAIFNGDSKYAVTLYNKCYRKKLITSRDFNSGFIFCDNIIVADYLSFDLTINGEKEHCKCKLTGRHNISNILVSAALAYELGISLKQIAVALSNMQSVPHRLEVIRANNINIIDDSFNANPDGAAAALEVLKSFQGNKKIIVTPGLVELGKQQVEENYRFGQLIASSADIVILIGENQTSPIKEGILSIGFKEENIYVFNSLEQAKSFLPTILGKDDVLLFENDLPDNYSEHS